MGNCCRSPAAVAREDVKTHFPGAHHDHGGLASGKHHHCNQNGVGGAQSNRLTVLCSDAKSVGAVEEKYALDRELGRGEFGVTYLCMDRDTRELLACKSISKRKLRTSVDVEDVRREVTIMRHLPRSPSIVSLREALEDDGAVHLVMELCEGGELFDRIVARGHYSERAAAVVMRTIVEVVQLCHKHGVIHRDLKPENFLFANKKENSPLKAIDFGLSIFFKPGENFSEIVGSPYYMAPEVLKRNYGPEIDIWSAGVILYILLCGVPPFWAETEQGVAQAILKGAIDFKRDPWPNVSESAKNLVQQMLEPEPKSSRSMSRWLLVAAAAAVAVLAVYVHVSLYSPISPLPLRLPVSPFNFPSNNLLQTAEKLGEGKLQGPEDVYVDGDGTLYTATRDGWIKRMPANGSGFEEWMRAGGGGLLGLALAMDDPERVLVCDADKGLVTVGMEGVVTLASHVDGTRIRFADDLAEASDGSIYFSDASSKFEFHDWFLDFLEATPSGRLLKYDPETKATSVVLDGLFFANGVALSAQQDIVVVCESSKFRCLKHWLKGDNKGQTEIFIDNLPGCPDNIKLAPDGSFWIAILQSTPKGFNWIHASPTAKKVIAAFPTLLEAAKAMTSKGGAMVVNVGNDGKMRRMLDDSEGKVMNFVTSVLEFDDHLYMGSLANNFVAKLRLK